MKLLKNKIETVKLIFAAVHQAKKFFSSVYDVCDPQYFTAEVCAQQPQNRLLAGSPYAFGLGYPYAIASPLHCGCPLRAGEANLQNIRWNLPELGLAKAVVKVIIFNLFSMFAVVLCW